MPFFSRAGRLSRLIFCLGIVMGSVVHASTSSEFVKQQLAAGKQANSLINEKSPYLLQHAFNPVHWLPWGDEAFKRAEREDKPVFLSIGYSTCHWCHVMAHESFEDEEVAAYLNEHFITIKVDREERPDLDQIYMAATQAISGGGGWPMSVFLLPDRRPFYAGTYFPPQSGYGRPGFLDLLKQLHVIWQEDRSKLTDHAGQVTDRLRSEAVGEESKKPLTEDLLHLCFQQAAQSFDSDFGGFGAAPKFPRPVIFDLLLRYNAWHTNEQAREMVLLSLKKMAHGGMYDQLGGGFHRYSVDGQWRVPHFEKMLYDQGQLASLYFDAFQVSQEPFYRDTGKEILDYVLRDMTAAKGGFYSAEDADSVDEHDSAKHGEGLFYLWKDADIVNLLGPENGAIFSFFYGAAPDGNALADPMHEFQGKNILYAKNSLAATAQKFATAEPEIQKILTHGKALLFAARLKRPRPHLDDKIITAWNGLMISAMAKGFKVTGDATYLRAATNSAGFLEKNLVSRKDNTLFRRYRDGEANFQGQLDDYAFFIQALLDLYSAGFDNHWLELAVELTKKQITLFSESEQGAFFDSPATAQHVLVRMRNDYDGAEPAGNSITAMNLLRLAQITGNKDWRNRAEGILTFFASGLMSHPFGRPAMAAAYDLSRQKPRQIIIAGSQGAADTEELLKMINASYLPTALVLLADNGPGQNFLARNMPFIEYMTAVDGKATAYVCENFTCKKPVNSPEELSALLHSSGH
jgi:hypothetical protein